jgi:hypothetical protein
VENLQHRAFKRDSFGSTKAEMDAGKRADVWKHLSIPRATWFHTDF